MDSSSTGDESLRLKENSVTHKDIPLYIRGVEFRRGDVDMNNCGVFPEIVWECIAANSDVNGAILLLGLCKMMHVATSPILANAVQVKISGCWKACFELTSLHFGCDVNMKMVGDFGIIGYGSALGGITEYFHLRGCWWGHYASFVQVSYADGDMVAYPNKGKSSVFLLKLTSEGHIIGPYFTCTRTDLEGGVVFAEKKLNYPMEPAEFLEMISRTDEKHPTCSCQEHYSAPGSVSRLVPFLQQAMPTPADYIDAFIGKWDLKFAISGGEDFSATIQFNLHDKRGVKGHATSFSTFTVLESVALLTAYSNADKVVALVMFIGRSQPPYPSYINGTSGPITISFVGKFSKNSEDSPMIYGRFFFEQPLSKKYGYCTGIKDTQTQHTPT